jgi:glycine cleavage system H lipoate-binding protein
MSLSKITFQASASSSPVTRYIQDGITLGEYLEDVESVTTLSNVTVEVNGEPADLNEELENGDAVSISQKKTASGQVAA